MAMTDEAVRYEKLGNTAVITLNRPHRRNALDAAVAEGMQGAVSTARQDPAVRTVVLTGAGGAFCAGADLAGDAASDDPVFFGRDLVLGHQRWLGELAALEKPVIAAVDGPAAGAGFSLALAADFMFVTPRTRLMASFVSIGLVPDLSMFHVLPRLVGLARAKEIIFSARAIGAEEALALGLAQALVPADQLLSRALDYARQFDDAPPRALALAKTLLNRSFETDRATMNQLEAAAQSLCGASQYHAEAVRRFLAKEALAYVGAELPAS